MRHKTAEDLAAEQALDGSEDLFYLMMGTYKGKLGMCYCSGLFKDLNYYAQNQLLKFCSDNNDTDAYNFYHSLI